MKKHTLNDLPDHIDKNNVAFTASDEIRKIAKPLFKKTGIHYFAHSISYRDGKAASLLTNPDVAIHWIVEKYSLPGSNPLGPRIRSGSYFIPYIDNIIPLSYCKALSNIFYLDHILLIVESYPERDEFFSFATELDNHKIVNYFLNNLTVFNKFIDSYKKTSRLSDSTSYSNAYSTPIRYE